MSTTHTMTHEDALAKLVAEFPAWVWAVSQRTTMGGKYRCSSAFYMYDVFGYPPGADKYAVIGSSYGGDLHAAVVAALDKAAAWTDTPKCPTCGKVVKND